MKRFIITMATPSDEELYFLGPSEQDWTGRKENAAKFDYRNTLLMNKMQDLFTVPLDIEEV